MHLQWHGLQEKKIHFQAFLLSLSSEYFIRSWSWWSTQFMYLLYSFAEWGWVILSSWRPCCLVTETSARGSLRVLKKPPGFLSCHTDAIRFPFCLVNDWPLWRQRSTSHCSELLVHFGSFPWTLMQWSSKKKSKKKEKLFYLHSLVNQLISFSYKSVSVHKIITLSIARFLLSLYLFLAITITSRTL